jgi:hypothetical protein
MEYSAGNKRCFDNLCRNFDSVLPFVGAGLSAFAYPCWSSFLKESAQALDDGEKSGFEGAMAKHDYESAASVLEKNKGTEDFRRDVEKAFCAKKLYTPEFVPKIKAQAAFILPELFKGLVLTTNFDRALERVYELYGKRFRYIGHPGNARLLCRALQKPHSATLYKFHGDISHARNLVLTKERYDRCYRTDGALARGLRACFKSKSMLFLGCSLNSDRTMDVLQSVLQIGAHHYAILDCDKEKLEEKKRELEIRGIEAIFYPDARHDSVCVVLEKLSQSVNR